MPATDRPAAPVQPPPQPMPSGPETFRDLLELARQGDSGAIETLLQRHLETLRAFVRLRSGRFLRSVESQSDLVQSVCREVLGDLADFRSDDEPAFKQWLLTVAHHKILAKVDYHRAHKRDAARRAGSDALDAYGVLVTPSQSAAVKEEIERIERAFDRLPPDYREVLSLACLAGVPHRQIAVAMGRSEVAVRKLLSRARARLAIILGV